jgi:oligoribonuclease
MSTNNNDNLIWIDLEMTGLDPHKDIIIEIATLVTDVNLNVIAEGPVFAIHQSNQVLDKMDEWNQTQHSKSGLLQRVKESEIDMATAENLTLEFLKQHVPANSSPMCGNSICQDRRFLFEYMPTLEQYFHYRHLDVSAIKVLAQAWKSNLAKFEKESNHLAMSDIYASIEELKYYREHFLKLN